MTAIRVGGPLHGRRLKVRGHVGYSQSYLSQDGRLSWAHYDWRSVSDGRVYGSFTHWTPGAP